MAAVLLMSIWYFMYASIIRYFVYQTNLDQREKTHGASVVLHYASYMQYIFSSKRDCIHCLQESRKTFNFGGKYYSFLSIIGSSLLHVNSRYLWFCYHCDLHLSYNQTYLYWHERRCFLKNWRQWKLLGYDYLLFI